MKIEFIHVCTMSLKEIDVYSNQWIAKAIINLRIVMQKERCKKKEAFMKLKSKDKCVSML